MVARRRTRASPIPNCCHRGARKRRGFVWAPVYGHLLHPDLTLLAEDECGDEEACEGGGDEKADSCVSIYHGFAIGMDRHFKLLRRTCEYLDGRRGRVGVRIRNGIEGYQDKLGTQGFHGSRG